MKKQFSPSAVLWRWAGAVLVPLALICLFELLRSRQDLMSAWVFGAMAPLEQAVGRLCSLFPFSVGEVLLFLFLAFCLVWVLRAVILLICRRELLPFVRRLCALGTVFLWIWAGVCWLWNAAYYVPSFAQRAGLETEAYSVETLASVTAFFAENAARLSTQVARDREGHFSEDKHACFDRAVGVYDNLSSDFHCLNLNPWRQSPFSALSSKVFWALPASTPPSLGRPT